MKVYVAARFERREDARLCASVLESTGYTVVSRWLYADINADITTEAGHDLEDIDAVDVLVFLSEDPTTAWVRGSRCVEYGYALARGKHLVVIGPRENVFHWLLPDTAFFNSIHDFVRKGALND